MLVLTRHCGETIVIADIIQITIVEVHGDRVRVGITAPPGIQVDRKEIYEAKRANASASAIADGQKLPKARPARSPHPGIEAAREPKPQPQGAPVPHVIPQPPPAQ